ncbi:MAG: Transcriptional regulator, GntR family [Variovorax sp.]|nr:Transcriptional regulator, GntR family [Variovorax sp.]
MDITIYPGAQAVTAEEEAYRHIHAAIRLGRYRAGDRLVPETIAAEIGTSRMPVREAFRRLATEGLVAIRPNRGATVNKLDVEGMTEIFEMRAVLEGLAMRLAVPRMDAATILELERMLDRIDDRSGVQDDWTTAHRAFHETLCARSGRPRLIRQIAGLHSLVEPHMRLWALQTDRPLSARADHQDLIDALRSGDADRCETTMREHVMATVPDLMKSIPQTRNP